MDNFSSTGRVAKRKDEGKVCSGIFRRCIAVLLYGVMPMWYSISRSKCECPEPDTIDFVFTRVGNLVQKRELGTALLHVRPFDLHYQSGRIYEIPEHPKS